METVLSWSLLMDCSAAVTVFTISVCFSRSSFFERENTKNVRTPTRQIWPTGRRQRSGRLRTTQRLLPLLHNMSAGCFWNSSGRSRQLRAAAAARSDSDRTFVLLQTKQKESNRQTFLYCCKIALQPKSALTNIMIIIISSQRGHRCLGLALFALVSSTVMN